MTHPIVITTLIFVSVGGVVWFVLTRRRRAHRYQMIKVLDALTDLKALLIFIQQHRGLTTGYLHGDATLALVIQQAALRIENQWCYVQENHPQIVGESLFIGIHSHWVRLSRRWKHQSVTNNIEQHNRLIMNLLYLIERQAESTPRLAGFARETGLDVIWKELLETIEAIGQTRAIGMGVVGAGETNAVERIQLTFLVEKVMLRLHFLEAAFETQSGNMVRNPWAMPFISNAKVKVHALVIFVEQSLLSGGNVEVSSETFFDLATSAIVPLDALFGEAVAKMKSHYEA